MLSGVEEERAWTPLLETSGWDTALKRNGFSGVDICLPDYECLASHTISVIISTAIEVEPEHRSPLTNRIVITNEHSQLQDEVQSSIIECQPSQAPKVVSIGRTGISSTEVKNASCIVLCEL